MSLKLMDGYVGHFQQPIQHYSLQLPTMFMLMDNAKLELDLILLTPGTFPFSFNYIKSINPISVKIFVPSLREEFISDVFNLYNTLKSLLPVKWVFPDKTHHDSFYKGQIMTNAYNNEHDSNLSVTYIANEYVNGVYDLLIKNENGSHYFSQHLSDDKLDELYNDYDIDYIHITTSNSIYGGLTYLNIMQNKDKKYLDKLIPHSFSSMDEYYYIMQKK